MPKKIVDDKSLILPKALTSFEAKQKEQDVQSSLLNNAATAQAIVGKQIKYLKDPRKASAIAVEQTEAYIKMKTAVESGFKQQPSVAVLVQLNQVLTDLPPMPPDFDVEESK